MPNDLPRRNTWAAALTNRQPGVHPSAAAARIIRAKLALHPGLEAVDLTSEEIRDAITRELDEKVRWSTDGTTFEVMGQGKRAWEGSEDELLQKLANSLAVRIAAAAEQERPTELTDLDTVRENLWKRGTYNYA